MAIYQHAVGVSLELTLPSTLSMTNASVIADLRKPDGSIVAVVAALDLGTSKVSYTTARHDLNQPGSYNFIATIIYSDSDIRVTADPLAFSVWASGRAG